MEKSKLEPAKGLAELAAKCQANSKVDPALYSVYDVKRGLRDINGLGVVAGLTQISEILSYEIVDGEKRPMDGILRYRGIHINDICKGFVDGKRFGFEETTYLLLFGELPNAQELADFRELLGKGRTLPTNFVRDVIMKAPVKI